MCAAKKKEGSQPIYQIKAERNAYVKMRDGTGIAVDIFRPDAAEKFPVLLAMSPYGKEMQSCIPPQGKDSFMAIGSQEAGNTEYIVSRGYVHIVIDVRGTGKSEGKYTCMFSKQEAEDGYDLVEWAAQQPWCDGNVGMVGISYFGVIQWLVAAEQPPHLKAIFPYDSFGDFYRDANYPGGILELFFWQIWRTIAKKNPVSVTVEDKPPEELQRLVEEAKKNADIRMYPWLYMILETPNTHPHFFDVMLNPNDGPFYWERSACTKYDKIKVPAFCGTGWHAYSYWHLTGTFRNYLGIKVPKKLLIDPPAFHARPWHDMHDLIIQWYDHWLKGIDTGIMDEPPIKIFVMGDNEWRYENEWPLARTKWTKYYLRAWEGLSLEQEPYYDEPDCFVQQPPIMTSTVNSLKFVTQPLAHDVEVTGPMALYLYASIDQDDTNWFVSLKDVDGQGAEKEVTKGLLKASHRAIDENKSKPWQPYHTHLKPEPVEPNEICEYAIEIRPTSNVFKKGHRIKLEIKSLETVMSYRGMANIPPYHMCSHKTTVHRIYRDKVHQSHLLLPIIPRD